MEYRDYYKILGVERSVTAAELKTAYRRLARKFHPDVSKEPNAEARFKEVQEAYEVLKDPEKRAAYDQLGKDWKSGEQFRPPPDWGSGYEFSGAGRGRGRGAARGGQRPRPAARRSSRRRTSATSSRRCSAGAPRLRVRAAQPVAAGVARATTMHAWISTSRRPSGAPPARSSCAGRRSRRTARWSCATTPSA